MRMMELGKAEDVLLRRIVTIFRYPAELLAFSILVIFHCSAATLHMISV